ncbi:cytoskeleton-associated protein 2-like [Nycticebus coucang]|uniref:cytoskeleton-associated protein 2-like n=1 Tax=Nycticebus coucang TaxID=9470 RepID=UPI00234DD01D|nr:cytoskeleton-associated protein 2-like [Nycticebus coucang]
MVGLGSAASAAAEERQRKLQEYLAAKGKLKSQNTKPYLKAKNNCPNLPPSKSTIRPQKNITSHVILPIKDKSSTSIKLQPRPASITGCQKPKLEPPKLPGKRLISTYVSTNPDCKPSSKSCQQHKARSSTVGELSKKPTGSLNIQELKTTKQQVIDQTIAKCTDSMDNTHVENESLGGFLKDTNKENLLQILSKPEKNPDPELCTRNKPKTNSYNLTKNSLASKQVLGKSSVNNAVLKDRMNKQSVGETRNRTLTLKSQQPTRGRDLARPGEKPPRIAPSQFSQTLSKTQSSKKTVVKEIKVNRSKYERPNETKLRLYPVAEQKVKPTKPKTDSSLLPQGNNNRFSNIRQNQRSTQPCFKPQSAGVLQKSKAMSQKHNSTVGHFNSVISSTPTVRANGTSGNKCGNSFQQKAQTLDYKLKKSLPQSHFLNKTAPKTQADFTNKNGQKVPNGTQANTNIKKKATVEDRRKQLEEWQKSKGKIYKRPPMEFKTKRKIIEEMNISFWKSIEKEEEERKAQLELSSKINNTLTECLKLIEGGEFSSEIHTILSSIPEAEKFAKFWICKAKLLASKGTFDVIGLYEEAIKNGATPIQELRDVVVNILQDPNRTTEAAKTNITSVEELTKNAESIKSCLSPKKKEQVAATPQITKAEQDNHPGIKLQIASIPRINGMPEVQDMKLITPVRRSARIERAVSRYPEMLQEHDLVVASLDELLEVEETECFIFRRNEALPVTLGFQVLES